MALFKSAEALCIKKNGTEIFCGIALPDNQPHKNILNIIKQFILKSGIGLFWVKEGGTVEIEPESFLQQR